MLEHQIPRGCSVASDATSGAQGCLRTDRSGMVCNCLDVRRNSSEQTLRSPAISTKTSDGQLETARRRTQRWTLGGRTMDTTMDTRWTLQKHDENYVTLGTCLVVLLFVPGRAQTVVFSQCPSCVHRCVHRVSGVRPPSVQRAPIICASQFKWRVAA